MVDVVVSVVVVGDDTGEDDGGGVLDVGRGLGRGLGALLGGCGLGWGRCAPVSARSSRGCGCGCGCSCRGEPAPSRRWVAGTRVETVTRSVDVLPSGAITTDDSTTLLTSAFGSGLPASGVPPASTDARAAIAVATTAPPAASRTTGEYFFFGFFGFGGAC